MFEEMTNASVLSWKNTPLVHTKKQLTGEVNESKLLKICQRLKWLVPYPIRITIGGADRNRIPKEFW